MSKQSDTKYAILGVLTTGCRTGYDIKQLIDQSLNHFWKISYGQIYPTLKQIVEEELATVKSTTQDGKPDKKEYYLTAKGELELQTWLQAPIKEISTEKNEVLLKIFFSRNQTNDVTISHLNIYKENLQERYKTYNNIEQMILLHSSNNEDAKYWLFTLDYGKRITKSAIEWCDETINQLKEE